MANATMAERRAAMRSAHAQRYEYAFEPAARPPPLPPAPPSAPRTPRIPTPTPPSELPRNWRELPTPPAWVRAYQRLTYGIVPGAQAAFNALGANDIARYEAMVDQQLAWESISDGAVEARLRSSGFTTLDKTLPQLWADHVVNGAEYGGRMRPAFEVQRATLVRATHSPRQLFERMVNFWNDHFNVSVTDYDAGPLFMHYNRNVMRGNALGNFRAMLEAMARSTSMMYYLDNRSNTRNGPNENFARELLELHTMGAENYLGFTLPSNVPPCPEDPAYPIGFTDIDVYETAAAFTGWTVNTGASGNGNFLYRESSHDPGPKFLLGLILPPSQPALKDGRDVLDRVATHPRAAKFICRKLIRHFGTDTPSQALIDSAAVIFRANWQAPDQIRITLRHILKSAEVRDGWGRKRRRPAELYIAAMRTAGADFTVRPDNGRSNDIINRLGVAGHAPHDWAAPNGFPDIATAWSGANSFVMTWKLMTWLAEANDDGLRLLQVVELSQAQVSSWTARNLVEFWCKRILGYLPGSNRVQVLVDFMAQNGSTESFVIANTNEWKAGDLKAHYNHDRLRNMVSMVLMSPELFQR